VIDINDKSDQYSVSTTFLQCNNESKNVNTTNRLIELRKAMYQYDNTLVCYIVPSEDEHFNEYTSFADQRRSFISGFDGSNGVAIVTNNLSNLNVDTHPEGKAMLSTDGRYYVQAARQLDYNWVLNKRGLQGEIDWQQFCINECLENFEVFNMNKKDKVIKMKIGVDPKLVSIKRYEQIRDKITKQGLDDKIELIAVENNLIDQIWPLFENPVERPCNQIEYLESKYAGKSFLEKRALIMEKLQTKKLVITQLDEICWLLNLRGSDIEYNPVFYAYLIIDGDETMLFTNNTFEDYVIALLVQDGVQVQRYQRFWLQLQKMASSTEEKINVTQLCSWAVIRHLNSNYNTIESPVAYLKSIKNSCEISNAKLAQNKDAFALVQYFAWLEAEVGIKERLIDEYKGAMELEKIRNTLPHYKGPSFASISSSGSNGAIIHYLPVKDESRMIDPSKPYLIDAGAQFLEGTTDVTRTLVLRDNIENLEELKRNYTLVLKGNLSLERMVFPKNTITGDQLDILARQYLWAYGLDYEHGTGHGIGSYLNVHEGPIGIGPVKINDIKLAEGMLISNEPGYYKNGEYGIRIENDILVIQHPEHKDSLTFENITTVPYCRRLIDTSLLNKEEINQINKYHQKVWNTLSLKTNPLSITYKYLKRETSPL
jgi:Xaa-Pro aminopeptidase